MRKFILAAAGLLALASAGFASASAVVSDETPSTERPSSPAELQADPSTIRFHGRADDPGDRAPWTLRTHKSKSGTLLCFEVGQTINGRFGREEKRGFSDRSSGATGGPSGSCLDLNEEPSPLIVTTEGDVVSGDGGRTLVYGVLDDAWDYVEVRAPGEDVRRIRPSGDRTYLTVYAGEIMDDVAVAFVAGDGPRRQVKDG